MVGGNIGDRARLLESLLDLEVIQILKERLSPEQRADLIMEIINPYRPLTTAQKAALGQVSERTIRDREARR